MTALSSGVFLNICIFLSLCGILLGVQTTCHLPKLRAHLHVSNYTAKPSYQQGESVSLVCENGYRLYGSPNLTCGDDGLWKYAVAPYCAPIICLVHASLISPHLHSHKTEYRYGEVVSFYCDQGYNLSAASMAVCGRDGQIQVPSPIACEATTCLVHASLISPHLHSNKTEYRYGEIISFYCDQGYNLSAASMAVCGRDGQIHVPSPIACEEFRCNLTSYTSPQPRLHLQKALYELGETIVFFCERGYRLEGVATATCGKDEQELLHSPPSCKGVRCPFLKLNNAVASTSPDSYVFPNIVHISCKPGYSTDNDTILSCTADGIWNTSVPHCKEDLRTKPKPSSMTVAIAASSAGALFVVIGIVVFVTITIRRKRSRNNAYEEPVRETHALEELDHQYAHISNYENPISPKEEHTEHPYSIISNPHQNEKKPTSTHTDGLQ